MVNRALGHAALMDGVYRRQRHVYDLTRRYYLFGRDRAISDLKLAPGARLVEVGCGTARNLVRIARRYPEAKLFGVDASAEMLRTASHALARAGLSSEVRLAHGRAEALSPAMFGEAEPFDAILFSYSLSMIPDWKRALSAADRWLKPDGRIHVVDFGDMTGLGRFGAWALRAWLALFHVSPRVELLRRIETAIAPQAKVRLRLLPGRYAFILALSKLPCHGGR
jgi:S-adenosylmethionine-diacylgycerolhomoserine-N-methlytransferase